MVESPTETEFELERAYDREELASVFRAFASALDGDRPLRIDDGERVAAITIPDRVIAAFEVEHESDDDVPVTELELELEWDDPERESLRLEESDGDAEGVASDAEPAGKPPTNPAAATMPPDAVAGTDESAADGDDGTGGEAAEPAAAGEGDSSGRSGRFEVYEDRGGEWRWRLVHWNGNIVADSGEGYSSRSNARRAARRVVHTASAATIEDREERDG